MTSNYLGRLLREHRVAKNLTQDDMARLLGTTRGNYGHVESGRRKDSLTPEQARVVGRHLGIDMLTLVNAMGYGVQCPGFDNEEEVVLLGAYRRLPPNLQQAVRAVAGLPLSPQQYEAAPLPLRRIADRPGREGTE